MSASLPLPPREFALRIGAADTDDAMEQFVDAGARISAAVRDLLPEDWSFEGRTILDFGCGAGRLLRHLAYTDAQVATIHGCDVDAELIAWVQENLCPPIAGAVVNDEAPPLPFPDSTFDLVIASSVFTHITDQWSAWLIEMQRVLKPDGLMVASFLGSGMSEVLTGEVWDEDRIGMNALGIAAGAPFVLHSPWWLSTHWGRVFEILTLRPSGFISPEQPELGHGVLLLRPRPVDLTIEEVERDDPEETRYLSARRHHLRQLRAEAEQVAASREPSPSPAPAST
jgi:SAM-dependent methyltransferase